MIKYSFLVYIFIFGFKVSSLIIDCPSHRTHLFFAFLIFNFLLYNCGKFQNLTTCFYYHVRKIYILFVSLSVPLFFFFLPDLPLYRYQQEYFISKKVYLMRRVALNVRECACAVLLKLLFIHQLISAKDFRKSTTTYRNM